MALACHRGGKDEGDPLDTPPLAAYASQRVALTPTSFVRNDSLGWVQQLGGSRATARRLDTAIVAALDARGIAQRWILPSELARSFERNRTYATDPYLLSIEPLRSNNFETGSKYGEPLSSQLRTMIALHEDARFVLMPIELRFEKSDGATRATLRVSLVDPRFTEARWVEDIKSDTTSSATIALAGVAARLADYFALP
jgi:hypothetical protein